MNAPANVPAVISPRSPLVAGERPTAIVPQTIEQVWRLAELSAASGLAPKDMSTPEKCAVVILHGLEVGLPPMQALQRICVINGRPAIWGDAVLGLVRASRLLESIKEVIEGEGDNMIARCIVKRVGDAEAVERTFSAADAKAAGLLGKPGPWQQYKKRMMQMRARSFCLRDVFPDVTGGMYLAEEVEDMRDVTPAAAIEPPEPNAEPAKIEASPQATPAAEATNRVTADEIEAADKIVAATDAAMTEKVDPETGEVVWEEAGERPATVDDVPEPTPPEPTKAKPARDLSQVDEQSGVPAFLIRGDDGKPGTTKTTKRATAPAVKPADKPDAVDEVVWVAECRKAAEGAKTEAEWATAKTEVFAPLGERVSAKSRSEAWAHFDAARTRINTPVFDGAQWLKDLEGAASGAATLDELAEVQTKIQVPAKKLAPLAIWKQGCSIVLKHSQRLMDEAGDDEPANILAGG